MAKKHRTFWIQNAKKKTETDVKGSRVEDEPVRSSRFFGQALFVTG